MNTKEAFFLVAIGWILGTAYYRYAGAKVFNAANFRYWLNFLVAPVITAALVVGMLKIQNVPLNAWGSAMLLLVTPGMLGEALVLTNLRTVMPKMQGSAGALYGAFLFAAYAFLLVIGEVVSMTAS